MANPCVLYNGKKYTREEFAALLHDGELSSLLAGKKIKRNALVGEIPQGLGIQEQKMSVIAPEASSNYANLTENKDGDFVFFHVGEEGYDTIKPSAGASTRTSTGEAAAIGKVGGVAMYYTRPEDQESMVTGPAKYAVTVPKEKVYDFNTDENNYIEEAKAMHEAENPGKAFDANTQLAYVTKIAGDEGYDMVVAEWDGKTRAQTTKELAPTDYLSKRGDIVTKPFNEEYQSNTDKGMVAVVPKSKQDNLDQIYKEINNERNSQNKYDDLYRLAENATKMEQADITNLINESDISQELKDKYNKAVNKKEGKRRTYIKTESVKIEGAPEGSFINVGMETGIKGEMLTAEEIKQALPEDVEVLEETVKEQVVSEVNGESNSEPTLIVKLSRPLTDAEMQNLLVETRQMGIPQMIDGEGIVHGTKQWGEFNPEFFYMPDQKSLSETIGTKTEEAKVAKEVDKLSDMFSTNVNKAVENARAALSSILPDVQIIVHDDYDSYVEAVGEEDAMSGGTYNPNTKTIHINKKAATKTTVAHEVFHAIVLSKISSDKKLQQITKQMIESVRSSINNVEGNEDLAAYLDDFASNYDENLQNEEKAAELMGYLAGNYAELPAPAKSIIKQWIDKLAKIFGLKPFTDAEAVNFFNTISEKIATGEVIKEGEVGILKSKGKGIENALKRFQANFKDPVSGVEFVYDKNTDNFKELEEEGYITKNKSINDFDGKFMLLHQPDGAFSGLIYKNGELLVEGKGGVYYPIKFHKDGYFWASTSATAKKMAEDLNKVYDANNGQILMALTSAKYDKLLSSTTAANGVMEIMLSKAFDKNFSINKEQIKTSLINAANKIQVINKKNVGLGLKIKKESTLEEVKSKIAEKLGPDNSSFGDRKMFAESLISNVADIVKNNPKAVEQFNNFFKEGVKDKQFKGTKTKGSDLIKISASNLTRAISEMLTEPILKEGVDRINGGQVYAILELNGKVVDIPSEKHESYPKAIQSKDLGNKVKLHILTDRVKWNDVFEDPETGDIVSKNREKNIYPSFGVSTTGLKLNTKNLAPENRKQISVLNKPLGDYEINKIRSSLRMKFKDSYIIDLLDSYVDAVKNNNVGQFEEVDFLIENGVTLNYIARTLVEEGNFNTKSQALGYLSTIGEKLGISEFLNRKQISAVSRMVNSAKKRGFSDAAVSQYLKQQGYNETAISKALIDYNNKAIQQRQKSEGLLVEGLDNKVKKLAGGLRRRLASAKGFLPKSVFEGIEDKVSAIESQLKYVSIVNKRFDKLLSKYDGDKESLIKNFDAYLRGKTVPLDVEFKAIAETMRAQIKGLAQQMIDAGLVEGAALETVKNNMESYLTRSYEIFDNKDWSKKLKQDDLDRAKEYFRKTLLDIAIKNSKETGLDVGTQLELEVEKEINKILSKEEQSSFVNSGKEGSKDLSILKKKEDIPMEIRALMGEYTDPIQNYSRTVSKMAALIENAKFLNTIKESGMGTFFFEENDPYRPKEYNVKIAGDTSKTYDPLNGLYTTKEIAEELSNAGLVDSISKFLNNRIPFYKEYMKILGTAKFLKTVESYATHAMNVVGNFEFMASGGYWKGWQTAFKVIKNDLRSMDNEELNKKIVEYTKLGIVNQNVEANEIRSMFSGDTFDMEFERRMNDESLNPVLKLIKESKKIGKKYLVDVPADLYQAEDDFFKIIAFENEKIKYANAEFKKDYSRLNEKEKAEVDKIASDIVKNTLPNYSRIPKSAKFLKAVPVAGTFISFQVESLRVSYNVIFNVAAKEIQSDNKAVRAIGYQRLFSIIATQGLKYMIMNLLSGIGSDDEEKVKNAKRFSPYYSKNSDIVVVGSGKGQVSYIDFSASDPRGLIAKSLNAFMSGENYFESFVNGFSEVISPFTSEDMLLSVITSIKQNEDPNGNEIYNPMDDDKDKIEKSIEYAYKKAFEPGTVTSLKKIIKSDKKETEITGQLFGYKTRDIDLDKQFYFRTKDRYADEYLNAKRIYNSAFYKYQDKKISREELDKAYDMANDKVKVILGEIKKDYDAAMFFGTDPEKIYDSMDKAGFSKNVANQIISGDFEDIENKMPLTPEELKQKIEESKQKVKELRSKKREVNDLSEIRRKIKERGQ